MCVNKINVCSVLLSDTLESTSRQTGKSTTLLFSSFLVCVWRRLTYSEVYLGKNKSCVLINNKLHRVLHVSLAWVTHHGLGEVLDKLLQSGTFQDLEDRVLDFLLVVHVIALMPTELVLCHHLAKGGEMDNLHNWLQKSAPTVSSGYFLYFIFNNSLNKKTTKPYLRQAETQHIKSPSFCLSRITLNLMWISNASPFNSLQSKRFTKSQCSSTCRLKYHFYNLITNEQCLHKRTKKTKKPFD